MWMGWVHPVVHAADILLKNGFRSLAEVTGTLAGRGGCSEGVVAVGEGESPAIALLCFHRNESVRTVQR
jgi:hypothetical protein